MANSKNFMTQFSLHKSFLTSILLRLANLLEKLKYEYDVNFSSLDETTP